MQQEQRKKSTPEMDFFTDYGDASRYKIQEVVGKGSYGVVCSAIDTNTGEKVAIKKIHNIFEHISDAVRILREIKLLRLLRHPDIVQIKHIMLPQSRRDFKDIYVVFELMESDLHQVIKANDDLTREHYQFFLYQLLRALNYIHSVNVYHRDLKPKNILANANCKLKICDFGLARVAFSDTPTTIFWTDYVATRWYRAPELCGSFYSKYTPAVDIWSIGCIFAEVLTGKPLFPGKNVVHQLDLITDLLGTPSLDTISRVRNEKARKYLTSMRKKQPVPFSQKFSKADPLALKLLERLLAFDPKDRPTAEEALADPYFKGLAKAEREPSCQPISKMEFEFERRRVTKEDIRELIFCEILEYHPHLLKDYINGTEGTSFLYPSAVGKFRKQFAYLEESGGKSGPIIPLERKHASLPRSAVAHSVTVPSKEQPSVGKLREMQISDEACMNPRDTEALPENLARASQLPQKIPIVTVVSHNEQSRVLTYPAKPGRVLGPVMPFESGSIKDAYDPRRLMSNAVLPPQPAILPPFSFYGNTSNQETLKRDPTEAERDLIQQELPRQCMAGKMVSTMAIDMRAHPFYLSHGGKADPAENRVAMEANLLQAKSPYDGIAAAAAHRKVGTINFGMSRMYKAP